MGPDPSLRWHRRGDHPVDTHVIVHHGRRRPAWLDECLASLESEPTNVLLVHSDSDNVGALRAAALAQGSAPFVSFVDDDDFVHPGAFGACLSAIGDGDVGAYTDFRGLDTDTGTELYTTAKPAWDPLHQLTRPYEVLHLHAWRRAAMTPAMLAELARWPTAEEALLMGLLVAAGRWRKVDVVGYSKRQHQRGAGARITGRMLRQVTTTVAPILLRAARR